MLQVLTRIMLIFCIFLLVVNVFAYILFSTSDEPITLSSLLKKLEDAPIIDFSLQDSVQIFQINSDWGLLDPLRSVINALGSVIGLAVWICSLVINLVIFVGYALYVLGLQSFSAYV